MLLLTLAAVVVVIVVAVGFGIYFALLLRHKCSKHWPYSPWGLRESERGACFGSVFGSRIGRIVSHRIVDVLCISGTIQEALGENIVIK